MTGLLFKLIVMPLGILALSWAMPIHLYYPNMYYAIATGLVLALAGHGMELLFLQKNNVWASTVIDFGAATFIAYFSQYVINGAYVTYIGAITTGIIVAIVEHVLHVYLVSMGKAESRMK